MIFSGCGTTGAKSSVAKTMGSPESSAALAQSPLRSNAPTSSKSNSMPVSIVEFISEVASPSMRTAVVPNAVFTVASLIPNHSSQRKRSTLCFSR
jgi:hypothetical protein